MALASIKKVDSYQLGDAALTQVRPFVQSEDFTI